MQCRKAAEARHDEGAGDADGGADAGPRGTGDAESAHDPPREDGVTGRPDERHPERAQADQELLGGRPAGHAAGQWASCQGGAR